jgi:hypothetical protein
LSDEKTNVSRTMSVLVLDDTLNSVVEFWKMITEAKTVPLHCMKALEGRGDKATTHS